MSKTLVAVSAHADDVELNAGGTVAKWAAAGGAVHVVMCTDNCSGGLIPPGGDESAAHRRDPDKTMEVRRAEQEAAAARYGGKVHYLDYAQRHYWDEKLDREVVVRYDNDVPVPDCLKGHYPLMIAADESAHAQRLADLLLGLGPDLVLTQTPLDLDPEHHAVASLVWRAFRSNPDRLGRTPLRFWMPGSSCQDGLIDPRYDQYEDISDFFETKLQLCACHASQMSRTRWDMVRKRAEFFGGKIGVRYAEPFTSAMREIRFGR